MGTTAQQAMILAIFIGILWVEPIRVSALRSVGVIGLQETRTVASPKGRQVLEKTSTSKERMGTERSSASMKGGFVPYTSSKRRVRGGSDPIHNRSWSWSAGIPFRPPDINPNYTIPWLSSLYVVDPNFSESAMGLAAIISLNLFGLRPPSYSL